MRRLYLLRFLFLMLRRPLMSTLFPYTTLFRSRLALFARSALDGPVGSGRRACRDVVVLLTPSRLMRSEEHTSELQSQSNLVCRLLLEKKNSLHSVPDTHHIRLVLHRHFHGLFQ